MTSTVPSAEHARPAGYRRPDVREWLRRSLVILLAGLVCAGVAALAAVLAHVAPAGFFALLGVGLVALAMRTTVRSRRR
jgi:hypothetical protein